MFDICFNVIEALDGLSICAEFDESKFALSFIEQLTKSYSQLLKSISINGMRQNLRDIHRNGENDLESMSIWSDVPQLQAMTNHQSLYQLFEMQVIKSPIAIAIEYVSVQERSSVTYEELAKRYVCSLSCPG